VAACIAKATRVAVVRAVIALLTGIYFAVATGGWRWVSASAIRFAGAGYGVAVARSIITRLPCAGVDRVVTAIGCIAAGSRAKTRTVRVYLILRSQITLFARTCIEIAVTAMWRKLAAGQARSVTSIVLSVVTGLTRRRVLDAVAAIGGKMAVRSAATIRARIFARAQVTLLARVQLTIAAFNMATYITGTRGATVVLAVVALFSRVQEPIAAERRGLAGIRTSRNAVSGGRVRCS